MNTSGMIWVERSDKINNHFTKLTRKKTKVTLWQNINDIHRIKKQAIIKRVDLKKSEMIFLPKNGLFDFSSQLPIYFLSKKKITIFKKDIFFNSTLNLVVKIPEKIMLLNKRDQDRKVFLEKEMVELMLEDTLFKSELMDFSTGGFAFKSSFHNIIRFQKGQVLDYCFGEQAGKVKVVDVTTEIAENLREKYFRVGVKKI